MMVVNIYSVAAVIELLDFGLLLRINVSKLLRTIRSVEAYQDSMNQISEYSLNITRDHLS